MRIYKLLNFNPEIRDGDRLLAKTVNLLAAIEDRSTQRCINDKSIRERQLDKILNPYYVDNQIDETGRFRANN
jgi:hypothetical protein